MRYDAPSVDEHRRASSTRRQRFPEDQCDFSSGPLVCGFAVRPESTGSHSSAPLGKATGMVIEPRRLQRSHNAEVLSRTVSSRLFPPHRETVPQLNEVYELELAFLESELLTDEELVRRGAYFWRVGDTLTRHYLMCRGEPVRLPKHSSSRLRSFFHTNQFKTGYGTHGLFPYRGKFHPQMIKGLLNVLGLKPGETVLDPMMGSGTVLIEATLLGIHSIGVDASPFCRFMTHAKLVGLRVPLDPIRTALSHYTSVFEAFQAAVPAPKRSRRRSREQIDDLFAPSNSTPSGRLAVGTPLSDIGDQDVRDFLLLAYLDSVGYSERSERKAPREQFRAILERYLFVAEKIQHVLAGTEDELGHATPLVGDARKLELADRSVDGIVFSPPYSFAIDYVENDAFHLEFLGVDLEKLREEMVGIRGRTLAEKFHFYKQDMAAVMSECARVLRPGRMCAVVVGTNTNQLARILGLPADEVPGIDDLIVDLSEERGLRLVRKLERQITGMANTMRAESILIFQRG